MTVLVILLPFPTVLCTTLIIYSSVEIGVFPKTIVWAEQGE